MKMKNIFMAIILATGLTGCFSDKDVIYVEFAEDNFNFNGAWSVPGVDIVPWCKLQPSGTWTAIYNTDVQIGTTAISNPYDPTDIVWGFPAVYPWDMDYAFPHYGFVNCFKYDSNQSSPYYGKYVAEAAFKPDLANGNPGFFTTPTFSPAGLSCFLGEMPYDTTPDHPDWEQRTEDCYTGITFLIVADHLTDD